MNPTFIIGLIQSNPSVYKMEGANKLKFLIAEKNPHERLKLINAMMDDFNKKAVA